MRSDSFAKYYPQIKRLQIIYIYIYIYWQHFFINTNFVKHNRHFLSTYFLVDLFVYMYINIYIKVKLVTVVEGVLRDSFSIFTTPKCRGGATHFRGLLFFTLDTYLIILSVNQ